VLLEGLGTWKKSSDLIGTRDLPAYSTLPLPTLLPLQCGTRLRSRLRHYPAGRKVSSSRPDVVSEFFQLTYCFQPHNGPGVHSASNRMSTRNRKVMFLGSRARPSRKAENPTAIYEPIVHALWDSQQLITL
jgi:hypothetical protein